MYFPQTLWKALDLRNDNGTAACGCVMNGVGCAVCGNPLGAVQTYCSTHSFRGSTALPKSSTYIFVPSAVTPTPAPSSLPQVPNSNAPASTSSASTVEPMPPLMPLSTTPPSVETFFSSEFTQSIASALDEFVDIGLFRGDGDLNFERDFGQWFNPDDVGMRIGEQTTPTMPSTTPISIRFTSSAPSSSAG
ncbi:Leunig-like protein [Mycena venus]|uniref:Leunig-like protein n=1 Tax=Mycena venus TaxID=2733690 RepID=A0A8H6XTI3_9AGAR|nr:Leunig-like protein [Mycena venus]